MSVSTAVPNARISNFYVPFLLVLPTLAVFYGIYMAIMGQVSTFDVVLCLVLGAMTEFGVTFGYHRMTVHKSFVAQPWLKAIVLALGSMAFQGPVINWSSVHTKHHAMSDQPEDPHTPTIRGFFFAHFEWLLEMSSDSMNAIREKYAGRYLKDPMYLFFDRTFLFWSVFSLLFPAALGFLVGGWSGAWSAFIFGGLIRVFMTSHVTWCVNSVCHIAGGRMFNTTDKSRNNFLVGIFALGEGWHNNHHAFPSSAFHGLRWWQIDFTAYAVRVFEKLGIVRSVVRIPEAFLEKKLGQNVEV